MNDDPIDEIEWMSESDKVESKRRRREFQRKLERERLAIASCMALGLGVATLVWVVFG